jgi:signal transduction histidine kinase
MTVERCRPEELAGLFLFEQLTGEQLDWLAAEGTCRTVEPGLLCRQGDPAEWLFVLLSGEVAITTGTGATEVETGRTDHPGTYGGAIQAYLEDRRAQMYPHSMRVISRSRFFCLPAGAFVTFMRRWFPMAVHLLGGLSTGTELRHEAIAHREHLVALGSLAAGLTHELNNPAAAATRAVAALRNRLWRTREKLAALADGQYSGDDLRTLVQLEDVAITNVASAPHLGSIEAADAQEELFQWFEAYEIGDGWDLAPTFVQAGLGLDFVNRVAHGIDTRLLDDALRWLNYTVETELLMREIEDSTARISALVANARQYSQLGRGPAEPVNVHQLLDATLMMFADRLADISVVKCYDPALPAVAGYVQELNQVWTNLIDNAIFAMSGRGVLTVTTLAQDDQALITVQDSGVGIPEEQQQRIFDPFFTTKPFGQGSGLGLEVACRIVVRRHHGDLTVTSRPGRTAFLVRLPSEQPTDVNARDADAEG